MVISKESEVKDQTFSLRQFLADYSSSSSIHGIKYVFTENKNWFTRSFWAAFLILSFGFSGYFLVNTFLKWYINPDIGMKKELLNIRELPFPAITICPQTKSKIEFLSFRNTYKTYWENFMLKASDADAARFESLLHVCEPELSYNIQLNDSKVLKGHEIVRTLKEISYSTNDSMMFCKFRSELRDCTSLFKEVITSLGVCYSMNMLNYNDIFKYNILNQSLDSQKYNKTSSWSLDNGYQTDDLNAFPYPIISQQHDALRIILKTNDIDMDYVCQGSNQGFKVFFHIPGDCPELSGKHLFVPIKHDVTVSMTAQMTRTSKSLLKYKPHQRKCHLTDERPLKFFKYYTKNLCNIECLANYTLNLCNCVEFSMPRENSSKICSYSQRNCSIMAKRNMMLSYNKANPGDYECGCLPSCTEITYKSDIFHTDFDFKTLFDSYRYDLSDIPGAVMSRLTIYFQEPQFEATERYPLFTLSDYIAACGGTLGLFMGFSILSFIELLYYLICLIANITRH